MSHCRHCHLGSNEVPPPFPGQPACVSVTRPQNSPRSTGIPLGRREGLGEATRGQAEICPGGAGQRTSLASRGNGTGHHPAWTHHWGQRARERWDGKGRWRGRAAGLLASLPHVKPPGHRHLPSDDTPMTGTLHEGRPQTRSCVHGGLSVRHALPKGLGRRKGPWAQRTRRRVAGEALRPQDPGPGGGREPSPCP